MFKLHIKTDNAAFEDDRGDELARILRELAERLEVEFYLDEGVLRDVNGNIVGKWELSND